MSQAVKASIGAQEHLLRYVLCIPEVPELIVCKGIDPRLIWAGEPKGMTIPPKLLGDFALLKDTDGKFVISNPISQAKSGVSWTEQGYPFYSGTVAYSQNLSIDFAGKWVWIEADGVADMVEFIVNGEVASFRPWAPYACEITSLLRSDENTITLRVTNSMKNFLECEAKPSGLLGKVYLRVS